MKPIWAMSGRFAGVIAGLQVYDREGRHVGYLRDKVMYRAADGRAVGELYNEDTVGKRSGIAYPVGGASTCLATVGLSGYADRGGAPIGGWNDPDF